MSARPESITILGELPNVEIRRGKILAHQKLDKSQFPFVVVGGSRAPYSLNEFYGYRAEDISEWCCVSLRQATKWKQGLAKPSKQAMKLFRLYADRKVLDSRYWPEGWCFNGASVVDPEGNSTTQRQLRAYYLVYQLASFLTTRSDDPKVVSLFRSIQDQAVE